MWGGQEKKCTGEFMQKNYLSQRRRILRIKMNVKVEKIRSKSLSQEMVVTSMQEQKRNYEMVAANYSALTLL